jgi:hypothetical protein
VTDERDHDEEVSQTAEELARELMRETREKGVSLTGPGGQLGRLNKRVLEAALDAEMTERLGYDLHAVEGRDDGNSRNGLRAKTVLTDVGDVDIDVPRDRDGSFEPPIVRIQSCRAGLRWTAPSRRRKIGGGRPPNGMTPEEFPAIFTKGWALPKPEPFLDHFLPLIDANAVFIQPMFPDAHGRAEIERTFRRLFVLSPDLIAIPQRSAVEGEAVYIESQCTTTMGRSSFDFAVVDRFLIRDDKIIERRSYTDPTSTLFAVLRHPSVWPRAIRSRFAAGS